MKVFDIHFSIQIWHFTKRQGQLSWVQKSGKSFLEELFRLPRWNIFTSLFRLQIRIWHFGDLLKVFKAFWLLFLMVFAMCFCNFQLCSRLPFFVVFTLELHFHFFYIFFLLDCSTMYLRNQNSFKISDGFEKMILVRGRA